MTEEHPLKAIEGDKAHLGEAVLETLRAMRDAMSRQASQTNGGSRLEMGKSHHKVSVALESGLAADIYQRAIQAICHETGTTAREGDDVVTLRIKEQLQHYGDVSRLAPKESPLDHDLITSRDGRQVLNEAFLTSLIAEINARGPQAPSNAPPHLRPNHNAGPDSTRKLGSGRY